ncbi:MAG: TIGR04282 family arsenosugar biosynthesis glycosyltransferase [Desulfuromonadales bacterium]|nr:TIGR04282 family arsenosugar biosynthesis glycosyltransferase [Desulfuromonadales bacterium]
MDGVDNFPPPRPWALGIFAKAPLPGEVKTRLCPPFTPSEAALFHRLSLTETVSRMRGRGFDLVLFHAGPASFFQRRFPDLPLRSQGEGDLGERMERALGTLLAGRRGAALIGADTPDLPPELVEQAFDRLQTAEVVTAPASDGGYVLIGESRHHPALFRQIAWGSSEVLAATRRQAAALGLAYGEVAEWDDVDDLPALRRLLGRSPTCRAARFAARLLGRQPPLSNAG